MSDDRLSLLRRGPRFAELGDDELAGAHELATERSFACRETLFREGEEAEEFLVVLAGRVKLTQLGSDGQEVIARFLGPGDMCAAVAIFPGGTYPATAEAVEETRALGWRREPIDALLRRYPAFAVRAMRVLSERVRELQDRVRELSTERVAQRIARALVRLARQVGRPVEEGVLLDLPLTREDLANMTGTTLYTVSRVLTEWETAGIVRTRRRRVVIRRPHGLVSIAEDLPDPAPPGQREGSTT
ncbi:MAG: Crp/Fnr family transcriptional regulator [Acidobacteria bacterium]|nr:Crp/Fnr family transcriptional regulator [Acidobacteriota bacterium]